MCLKHDPYEACRLRVKANSVLCLQCAKWVHGRCAGVKRVTVKFLINFACRKSEGILEKQCYMMKSYIMKWKQSLCI